MQIDCYHLPAYWASYLINGDAAGLDDHERAVIDRWLDAAGVNGACLGCTDEPAFMRYHSAYPEVLAADCLEFQFSA